MALKVAQVSQGTIDQKKKSRAIIAGLFPQFIDNPTLQATCTARDSLIHMDKLCTLTHERYSDQTVEYQWSHVVNFLNEALVKRIHAKGTATDLPPTIYNLKSEDYRDALKAANIGTVNIASLSAMANRLHLATNSDGIMTSRQATSPLSQAQANPVGTSSAGLSATNPRPARSDNDQPSRPTPAPSGPIAVSERQLYDTYSNVPMFADLTIALRDRPVYVSRIMLCRASAHFAALLKDSAQVCRTQYHSFTQAHQEYRFYKLSFTRTTRKP